MKKIIKNILHTWYLYLISFVAVLAVVIITTNAANQPKDEEVMNIFVASFGTSNSKLYSRLLEDNDLGYLRKLTIRSAVYTSSDYDVMYTSFGKTECDLIILPESKLYDSAITYYYTPLNVDYMNEKLGSVSYYTPSESTSPYGVLIREAGDTENTLIKYTSDGYDENYYAFMYNKSFHAGKNNGVEKETSIKFIDIIRNYK